MKRFAIFTVMLFTGVLAFSGGQPEPKVSGDFHYIVSGGKARIVDYTGEAKDVVIPDTLDGKKVAAINNRQGEVTGAGRSMVKTYIFYAHYGAFQNKGLTSVIIPDGVTTIERDAFKGNSLTSVVIPNSVKTIGEGAFRGNQLTSVSLGENVTSIEEWAFAENQLADVVFPNRLKNIERDTFRDNCITSITLGKSITTIDMDAFIGSTIQNVSVAPGNSALSTKDSFLLGDGGKKIILYYGGEDDIIIPSYVTCVGKRAFAGKDLSAVYFLNSLTEIGNYAFYENQLTSITIPENVVTVGSYAFASNRIAVIGIYTGVKTIKENAFANNGPASISIGSAPIGESESADYRNNKASESVMYIGNGAFAETPPADLTICSNVYMTAGTFDNRFYYFYRDRGRRGGVFEYNEDTGTWEEQ